MQHIIEIEYCKKTDYKLQIIIVKAKLWEMKECGSVVKFIL